MSQTKRRPSFSGAVTPPKIGTLVLIAGSSVMAMNIFLPVLPEIGRSLGTSQANAQYVLTIFLLATAFIQLIVGPLADRFGRRPVLLATSTVFIIGTLICIFATRIEVLLLGRVLQASSAACMALSRAIIRDLFDRSKAASMIGYVTMAMALLPMVTPMMGGYVGEEYGWRATFIVLLVVGILIQILIYLDLGETHQPVKSPVSKQISDYLSLLKMPEIWGYFMCATLASGAYFAFLGGAPFVGQQIIGLTPSVLGMYFGLLALGYMAGNFISGRFSERIGIEPMMFLGSVFCTIGTGIIIVLMSNFSPIAGYLFVPMVLVGFGNGMTLPNANAGAVSVRPELAGSASGLGGFLQIGGGAALAILAGNLITIENLAMPLYYIMFVTSLGGCIIAAWMHWRTKQLSSTQ